MTLLPFLPARRSAHIRPRVRHPLLGWVLCWVGCLLLAGCRDATDPAPQANTATGPPPESATDVAAAKVLEKMRSVYRQANSYTDNASVVFYAVLRMTGGEQETPYTRTSVAYQKPNRLSLTYQKTVSDQAQEEYKIVSNGIAVHSAANELPDQIHEAISPREFSAENFIPEPALRSAILQNSIENTFPQLALLFAKDADQPIFPGEEQPRLLADANLDDKPHHRLELESPAGKRVLWVDQDKFTLRRMEIPIDNQRQEINARNQFSKVSVWIDFAEVTIDPEIEAGSFELAVPAGTRRVRRFIPPPPAGPPEFLGKPVGQFAFQGLDGQPITPATLAGKVAVLDFWMTNCPPCHAQTPVMNQVYEHFRAAEEVVFLAVCTDRRDLSDEVVAKTMARWGGAMPVVRDLDGTGYYKLDVRQTPTLLLVDREGRLQVYQAGAHQRAEPLIRVIERLVDGEDLVATDRRKVEEFARQYEQALDAATIEDSIIEVEIARPEVPPLQLPERIQLEELWRTTGEQVGQPGDVFVLAAPETGDCRILVLDRGESVVELDAAGKVLGRHELPAHDERSGGFLRSWANAAGQRWYLVSGVGWQKVFVCDKNWEPVLTFPDEQHSGIGDVLLADLTDSGAPQLVVGYWGGMGVQGGTLAGRRLWANRRLDHVLQIGLGPPVPTGNGRAGATSEATASRGNRTTWCSSTRGTLLRLGADGKSIEERDVTGQALMYFAAQPAGQNYCGLSVSKVGQYTAVGFDDTGTVAWQYPLPPGEYLQQLPRVQSVRLPAGNTPDGRPSGGQLTNRENDETQDERGWLVAAANGSLHWLNEQGELIDRFDCGDILTGVRMCTSGDQTRLLVATTQQLTAWRVRRPARAPGDVTQLAQEATLPITAESTSVAATAADAASEAAAAKAAEQQAPAAGKSAAAEPAESTESD